MNSDGSMEFMMEQSANFASLPEATKNSLASNPVKDDLFAAHAARKGSYAAIRADFCGNTLATINNLSVTGALNTCKRYIAGHTQRVCFYNYNNNRRLYMKFLKSGSRIYYGKAAEKNGGLILYVYNIH